MKKNNSKIEESLKAYWQEYSNQGADKRPRHDPHTIICQSAHHSKHHNVSFLNDYVIVLEEYISWFLAISCVLFKKFELLSEEDKKANNSSSNKRLFLYWCVINAIILHLFSIRLLIVSGFDITAKQILRALREWVDFLFVLHTKDDDIAEEFFKSASLDDSNRFWHTYISKYKARKGAEEYASRFLEGYIDIFDKDSFKNFPFPEMIDEWKSWKKDRDSFLSAATHPSIRTAYLSSMMSAESIDGPWFPSWGLVTSHSLMTIDYTLATLTEIMVILHDFPFKSDKFPDIKFDNTDEDHRQISSGRVHLPGLVAQLNYLITHLIEKDKEN